MRSARKVIPINSHDHWADYAEMQQPRELKPVKRTVDVGFICAAACCFMVAFAVLRFWL